MPKLKTESIKTIPALLDEWFKNRSDGQQRVENFVVPEIGFSSETLIFDLITCLLYTSDAADE